MRSTTRTSARPSAAGARRPGLISCCRSSARDVRDGIGWGFDFYTDPLNETKPFDVRWGLVGLRLIQTRADLLEASRILEEAALDKYVFQRDAYLQRRRNLVYDGRPPREKEPDEDSGDKPQKPAAEEKEIRDDQDQKPR